MAWMQRRTTQDGGKRYRIYWYDPAGRQRSKTFRGFEEARKFASNVESKMDEGSYVDPALGKITVSELAERFMTTAGARLRPSSRALYGQELRANILPTLGARRLSSLSKADVRDLEAELRAEGKSEATVAAIHRLLHRLFAFAIQEDRIGRNPADLPKDERPRSEPRKARFLDEVEVAAIAGEVPDRYRALVWTLAVSGLRIGEATALQVGDIDPRAGRIRVQRNAPEVGGVKLLDQPTKTGKHRTVDVPASLTEMLTDHLNTYANRFDTRSLVFTTASGSPVRQGAFRSRIFLPAVERAGIEPAPRVHDLRHTAASFMARARYTLLEAAEQLGHSATEMTERYSHVFEDTRQEKVARLDALIR